LLLGVVCLVTYTRKDAPVLVQDHPIALTDLPYSVTYAGMTSPAGMRDRNNDLKFLVQTNDGKQTFTALMPCAVRDVEGTNELLARPAIFNKWWGDLYFALKSGPDQFFTSPVQRFKLTKGQTADVDGYRVKFIGFSVPPDVAAQVNQGIMPAIFPVTAVMQVTTPNGKSYPAMPQFVRNRIDPLAPQSPELALPKLPARPQSDPLKGENLPSAPPPPLPDRMVIAFESMIADQGNETADFYIRDAVAPPVAAFTIEVSTRPGIGLVWLGTLLIAFGGLLAMRRRALENRLIPVPEPPTCGKEPEPVKRRRTRTSSSRKPAPAAMKGGH
ncbi:MAG TPA: hypothetical protein VFW40_06725, partial [Capsulimonadaceae bacterium]|nr:hypothetical protein [Capsulimonadaceae bacterium]